MGNKNSKPSLLTEPWRQISWRNNQAELQFLQNYRPLEGEHIRILLYGPVGSGKSSFISSVQSVLQGRMYIQAFADTTSYGCFTKEYVTYKIQKDFCTTYPFVFNDIMGLSHSGILKEDIKLALKGHIKEGYKFNPASPISADASTFYNESPTCNDKVHVLVGVVAANNVALLDDKTLETLRDIRVEACALNIPQVVIITKIDLFCPEIKEDLKNVYKATDLKQKMEIISVNVGIPMNCIFPVKNYHEEIDLRDDQDSLILSAMRNIITFGNDFIHFNQQRKLESE